jgi:hypothetical protein
MFAVRQRYVDRFDVGHLEEPSVVLDRLAIEPGRDPRGLILRTTRDRYQMEGRLLDRRQGAPDSDIGAPQYADAGSLSRDGARTHVHLTTFLVPEGRDGGRGVLVVAIKSQQDHVGFVVRKLAGA